jgi:hypothetical protein
MSFTREVDDEDLTYMQPLPGPKYADIPRENRDTPSPYESLSEYAMNRGPDSTEHADQSTVGVHEDPNYESLDDYSHVIGQTNSHSSGQEKAVSVDIEPVYATVKGEP